eukprot:754350-Hanusia_phi.AAC.1
MRSGQERRGEGRRGEGSAMSSEERIHRRGKAGADPFRCRPSDPLIPYLRRASTGQARGRAVRLTELGGGHRFAELRLSITVSFCSSVVAETRFESFRTFPHRH